MQIVPFETGDGVICIAPNVADIHARGWLLCVESESGETAIFLLQLAHSSFSYQIRKDSSRRAFFSHLVLSVNMYLYVVLGKSGNFPADIFSPFRQFNFIVWSISGGILQGAKNQRSLLLVQFFIWILAKCPSHDTYVMKMIAPAQFVLVNRLRKTKWKRLRAQHFIEMELTLIWPKSRNYSFQKSNNKFLNQHWRRA